MFATQVRRNTLVVLLTIASLAIIACGGQDDASTGGSDATATLPDTLFLSEAPDGIETIASLKASAKEGDEVVVRGIVGGNMEPIVAGRASASIMDAGIDNKCTSEEDHCMTPWDYCCTPQEVITKNLATLQITDDAGQVLKADLEPRIKPLTTIIIKGIVGPRPNDQVLTIQAQAIYVEDEVK